MSRKVDTKRLFQLIREGKSQKECARVLGVSEGTISKILKKTKTAVNKEIALFATGEVLDMQIDYMRDLRSLQQQSKDLLDMIYSVINEEDDKKSWAARDKLRRLTGSSANLQSLLISLHAELRRQMEFSFNIDKVMADMQSIKKFQEVILDAIRKTDPETGRRIASELARLKLIRTSLDLEVCRNDPAETSTMAALEQETSH